jgi:hypothetical protein
MSLSKNLPSKARGEGAPKLLGDAEGIPMASGGVRLTMSEATPVFDVRWKRFGNDMLAFGRFRQTIY